MQRSIFLLIAAISLGGIIWLLVDSRKPDQVATPPPLPTDSTTTATPATAPTPEPGLPRESAAANPAFSAATLSAPPETTPLEPLPALAESDGFVAMALGAVIAQPTLQELFNLDQLVRRIVVTIDNLPRAKLSQRLRLLEPPAPSFLTIARDGETFIAEGNAARYQRYVGLLEAVDIAEAAALYRRLYPLCQQVYADIAPPGAVFHQRVLAALDDLLAAPPVPEPVRLVQPKVFFEFADPEVQARSYGQRLLARMGNANASRVQAKLRALRAALR